MRVAGEGRAGGASAAAPRRRRVFHRCSCGRPIPEGVLRCSSRTCPEYAPIWARDTRRRLFENLKQLKLSVMFSVTAPGADLYPFDPRLCSHRPVERCSGRLGCRVDPEVAAAFNRNAGKWWSELRRTAKTRADRAAPGRVRRPRSRTPPTTAPAAAAADLRSGGPNELVLASVCSG